MTKRPRPPIASPRPYSVRLRYLLERIPQTKDPEPALALLEALVEHLQRGDPVPEPLAGTLTEALLLEMRGLADRKDFDSVWPSLAPLLEGEQAIPKEPGAALARALGLRGRQGPPTFPKREMVAAVEDRLIATPGDDEYSRTLEDALEKVSERYGCAFETVRNACSEAGLTLQSLRERGLLEADRDS